MSIEINDDSVPLESNRHSSAETVERLTLVRPDDWHVHLRDDEIMVSVLPDTARRFARAVIMPNLDPPVVTTKDARAYRARILAALPVGMRFEPLMTLYLTDRTSLAEITRAKKSKVVHAVKYYPAGATTNAKNGVTDLQRVYPVFALMEKVDLPLLLHGEVTDTTVDVFDREAIFIDRHVVPLVRAFPNLRIVLEHITTHSAVEFVNDTPNTVAATITAHHLLLNRNALFADGLRPHLYCSPLLKRERHRAALVTAATSGSAKFFLGSDSAPHPRHAKESACGCAGIYTAHAAVEFYAEVFEQVGALDGLEAFTSFHGPDFYRLPRNKDTITIEKTSWKVPEEIRFGNEMGVPLRAGGIVTWKLA